MNWPKKKLSEVLAQRFEEHRITDAARETFVTIRLYGKGATPRKIGAGKTPVMKAGYRLRSGDLVYSRIDARNGAFALVPVELNDAVVSKDFPTFAVNREQIDPRFLSYYLGSEAFFGQLQSSSFGTTNRQRISEELLLSYRIPVPPLADQERIVKLLDEADELRDLRQKAILRSAQLVPGLFDEMFGDPASNPKGWDVCPVSSFVMDLYGGRSVNPAGADEAAGRFRVLKISAVTRGDFRAEESKPVPACYEPPSAHFVHAGDLLFSRANTTELVGATSYVFETPPNLLLPDKLWQFVWREPHTIEPLFVWWLFQSASVRRELSQRATGTGGSMKNISKPKVMSLTVPVPPLPLQIKFAKRANEIREMDAEQATSRQRLDHLFQSMLHRSFNGEI